MAHLGRRALGDRLEETRVVRARVRESVHHVGEDAQAVVFVLRHRKRNRTRIRRDRMSVAMKARWLVLALISTASCAESAPPPQPPPSAAASLEVPPLPPPSPAASAKPLPTPPPPSDDPLLGAQGPRDPARAEAAFAEARAAMNANNLPRARDLFVESYRLDPAIGTVLNLATVEEKLGDRENAIRHYQMAYDDSMKAGRYDRAQVAKARIDALKSQKGP
jgi:hypothetical protein